ncbi:hypothetical protein [Streptomyces albus]|uniref:hypothetical protein n=1 Tax=Streptomyces albus TaxID=1888 RepID=UPI0004CC2C90|nr:hypothetical protein [Streptomyces albus]
MNDAESRRTPPPETGRPVHRIRKQRAEKIYNGTVYTGTVHQHRTAPEPSPGEQAARLLRSGETFLREGLHARARESLGQCLSLCALDPAQTADARFLLALATLDGRRPSLCSGRETTSVLEILTPLQPYHLSARFLAALVSEDRTHAWRGSSGVPEGLRLLVRQVDREHARLICRHVPAPECRTWRALHDHAAGGEPW